MPVQLARCPFDSSGKPCAQLLCPFFTVRTCKAVYFLAVPAQSTSSRVVRRGSIAARMATSAATEAAEALQASPPSLVLLERSEATQILVSFGFEPGVGAASGSASFEAPPLLADIAEYCRRFSQDGLFRLLISWEDKEGDGLHDVRVRPPTVRLLYPMLEFGAGRIINGMPVLPELLPAGWNPIFDAPQVVTLVRDSLLKHGARVHLEACAFHNKAAFDAVRSKVFALPDPALAHPKPLARELSVFSSTFALEVMGLELPAGFEYGNKVLLSPVLLHAMTLSDSPSGAGGMGGALDGLLGIDGGAGFGLGDESALTFELVSHLGFPVYCGVAEFTCPHPDVAIVPAEMLAAMCIPEGSKVDARRVRLPPVTRVTLQPHSANFQAVESFLSMTPRRFLERSLVRYATVQAGDVLTCDGGPTIERSSAAPAAAASSSLAAAAAGFGGGAGAGRAGPAASAFASPTGAAAVTVAGGSGSDYMTDEQLTAMLIGDAFGPDGALTLAPGGAAGGGAAGGGAGASSDVIDLTGADEGKAGDAMGEDGEGEGEGEGDGEGAGGPSGSFVFRFTVVSCEPAGAPALSLWAAYAGSVEIEFLPAADEFEVPRALPAGLGSIGAAAGLPAGAAASASAGAGVPAGFPPLAAGAGAGGYGRGQGVGHTPGLLRMDMLSAVFGDSLPGAGAAAASAAASSATSGAMGGAGAAGPGIGAGAAAVPAASSAFGGAGFRLDGGSGSSAGSAVAPLAAAGRTLGPSAAAAAAAAALPSAAATAGAAAAAAAAVPATVPAVPAVPAAGAGPALDDGLSLEERRRRAAEAARRRFAAAATPAAPE